MDAFKEVVKRMTIEKCKNSGTVNSASILWGNAIKLELLTFSLHLKRIFDIEKFLKQKSLLSERSQSDQMGMRFDFIEIQYGRNMKQSKKSAA